MDDMALVAGDNILNVQMTPVAALLIHTKYCDIVGVEGIPFSKIVPAGTVLTPITVTKVDFIEKILVPLFYEEAYQAMVQRPLANFTNVWVEGHIVYYSRIITDPQSGKTWTATYHVDCDAKANQIGDKIIFTAGIDKLTSALKGATGGWPFSGMYEEKYAKLWISMRGVSYDVITGILAQPIKMSPIRGVTLDIICYEANVAGYPITVSLGAHLWYQPEFDAPMPPPAFRGGVMCPYTVPAKMSLPATGCFAGGYYYDGIYDGLFEIVLTDSTGASATVGQFGVINLAQVSGSGTVVP